MLLGNTFFGIFGSFFYLPVIFLKNISSFLTIDSPCFSMNCWKTQPTFAIIVKKLQYQRGSLEKKDQKYVHNTVVHIENEQGSYWRYGYGVSNVLRLSLALGRYNDLLRNNLMIEVDGQKTLQEAIIKAFL